MRNPTHSSSLIARYSLLLLLLAACAQGVPAATPTPRATLVPSLTPSPDIAGLVNATLTAIASSPAATPPAGAAAEASAEVTDEPIRVTLQPLAGEKIPPPLDINLQEGWQSGYDVLVLQDADGEIRGIPLAVYQGPITGGTGVIVLLWGFPSLTAGNPFLQTTPEPDLWSDGLRLLRLAVFDPKCNIGTDLKRDYRIGTLSAVGTQFAAVTCPEGAPDTRGWFAGLQDNGLNFIFYIYADPIDAMQTGQDELQAVLDTVRFHVPEATPDTGSG